MEVISIERSTYEELLTSFNSFVTQMKAIAGRGTDKRLGEWLDNQDVCQILNISPRTLQTLRQNGTLAYSQIKHKTYYKPEDIERIISLVEIKKKDTHSYRCHQRKGGSGVNELIMPHNTGVKRVLENMKEVLALYKNVTGNYRPLLDGERYMTDREVAEILKVSRRTLQEYRNDRVLPYISLGGKVLYRESDLEKVLESCYHPAR